MDLPVFLAFIVVIIPFNVVDDDEGVGCISTTVVVFLHFKVMSPV